MAAEAAAGLIQDSAVRAASLVRIGAVVAAAGDAPRADRIFELAADASAIPCAEAERLATQAQAAAGRGHDHAARALVLAIGRLTGWITEPHNQVRAIQARLAVAIHLGDLDQAEDSARAIAHPDLQALALIDVARAYATAGQTQRAITIAMTISIPDRQADALSDVARLAATHTELDLAEFAAHAITAPGARSPALLGIAWEASRLGDVARAERIVASIAEEAWRQLGIYAIQAQHNAPPTDHPRSHKSPPTDHQDSGVEATTDGGRRAQELLDRADAIPDDPSAITLLAEVIRAGPCIPTLASLGRVDPSAALAAAETLMTLLQ